MTEWLDLNEGGERAIEAFMMRVAALPTPSGSQDPMRVWWKAQLLRKWDAERRAQLPIDVMHRVEIAGGLLAAGLLLYWSLPHVF